MHILFPYFLYSKAVIVENTITKNYALPSSFIIKLLPKIPRATHGISPSFYVPLAGMLDGTLHATGLNEIAVLFIFPCGIINRGFGPRNKTIEYQNLIFLFGLQISKNMLRLSLILELFNLSGKRRFCSIYLHQNIFI